MWIYIVILAVVQGIAEFLPISSSGHLAILGTLFGFSEDRSLAPVSYTHLTLPTT